MIEKVLPTRLRKSAAGMSAALEKYPQVDKLRSPVLAS